MAAELTRPADARTRRDGATPRRLPTERRILAHDHREIEHLLGHIENTAEMAGNLASPDLTSALRNLLDAIQHTLCGHLHWEETVCYREMDGLVGTPWATRFLRFQHEQIRRSVDRLEEDGLALRHEPTHGELVALRARLYRLHALLCAHIEQEESALIPFLDAASDAPPCSDGTHSDAQSSTDGGLR